MEKRLQVAQRLVQDLSLDLTPETLLRDFLWFIDWLLTLRYRLEVRLIKFYLEEKVIILYTRETYYSDRYEDSKQGYKLRVFRDSIDNSAERYYLVIPDKRGEYRFFEFSSITLTNITNSEAILKLSNPDYGFTHTETLYLPIKSAEEKERLNVCERWEEKFQKIAERLLLERGLTPTDPHKPLIGMLGINRLKIVGSWTLPPLRVGAVIIRIPLIVEDERLGDCYELETVLIKPDDSTEIVGSRVCYTRSIVQEDPYFEHSHRAEEVVREYLSTHLH